MLQIAATEASGAAGVKDLADLKISIGPPGSNSSVLSERLLTSQEAFNVGNISFLSYGEATGAHVTGPVPLPTERNVWCVIKSPHKYKDSREHFEMRTHKRLIDIHQPTQKTIDKLMGLSLPAGVDIEIKL